MDNLILAVWPKSVTYSSGIVVVVFITVLLAICMDVICKYTVVETLQ